MAGREIRSQPETAEPRWTPVAKRSVTLAGVRKWPPTCSVEDSAVALGCSRATAYAAIAEGTFPVATIRVNRRLRVLTADLLRVLEGQGSHAAKSA
jgi:hypothetical protein